MSHPVDDFLKRMLELTPEGFDKMMEEAIEEVVAEDDQTLPETITIDFESGEVGEYSYADAVLGQRAQLKVFDKLFPAGLGEEE